MGRKSREKRAQRQAEATERDRDRAFKDRIANVTRALAASPDGSPEMKAAARGLAEVAAGLRRAGSFARAREAAALGQRRTKRLCVEEGLAALGEGRFELAREAAKGAPELAEVLGTLLPGAKPKQGRKRSPLTPHVQKLLKLVWMIEEGELSKAAREAGKVSVPEPLSAALSVARLESSPRPVLATLHSFSAPIRDLAIRVLAAREGLGLAGYPAGLDQAEVDLWARSALTPWRSDRSAMAAHLSECEVNHFLPEHRAGARLYSGFGDLSGPDASGHLESALSGGADPVECLRGMAMAPSSDERFVRYNARLSKELEERGAPELAMAAALFAARDDKTSAKRAFQHRDGLKALAQRLGLSGPTVDREIRLVEAAQADTPEEAKRIAEELLEDSPAWIDPWEILISIEQDPAARRALNEKAFAATKHSSFREEHPEAGPIAVQLIQEWQANAPTPPFDFPAEIATARAELGATGQTALELVRIGLLAELGRRDAVEHTIRAQPDGDLKNWLLGVALRFLPDLMDAEHARIVAERDQRHFEARFDLCVAAGAADAAGRLLHACARILPADVIRRAKERLREIGHPHFPDNPLDPFHAALGAEVCLFGSFLEQVPEPPPRQPAEPQVKKLLATMPADVRAAATVVARLQGVTLEELIEQEILDRGLGF